MLSRLASQSTAALRLGGLDAHKACVLALVLTLHALLLTARLPQRAAPPGPPHGAPISVRLLTPRPFAQPAVAAPARRVTGKASAKRQAPMTAAPGPEATAAAREPSRQPVAPGSGEPATGTEQPTRAPFLHVPKVRPADVPPTLAERARARSDAMPHETQLQRDVARSLRPDCRQAYSGLVLLAIPALLRDSLRDDGCRW